MWYTRFMLSASMPVLSSSWNPMCPNIKMNTPLALSCTGPKNHPYTKYWKNLMKTWRVWGLHISTEKIVTWVERDVLASAGDGVIESKREGERIFGTVAMKQNIRKGGTNFSLSPPITVSTFPGNDKSHCSFRSRRNDAARFKNPGFTSPSPH